MRNKCVTNHVLFRNETYYFLKRVPYDFKEYYSVKRLCFSLKTKSYSSALRITINLFFKNWSTSDNSKRCPIFFTDPLAIILNKRADYSSIISPEPPKGSGKSLNLGNPSFI